MVSLNGTINSETPRMELDYLVTEGSASADIETIAAHLLLSFQKQVANHELYDKPHWINLEGILDIPMIPRITRKSGIAVSLIYFGPGPLCQAETSVFLMEASMHTTERYQYCIFQRMFVRYLRIATASRSWGRVDRLRDGLRMSQ